MASPLAAVCCLSAPIAMGSAHLDLSMKLASMLSRPTVGISYVFGSRERLASADIPPSDALALACDVPILVAERLLAGS